MTLVKANDTKTVSPYRVDRIQGNLYNKPYFTINEDLSVIVISAFKMGHRYVEHKLQQHGIKYRVVPCAKGVCFYVNTRHDRFDAWLVEQYAEFREKHVRSYTTKVRPYQPRTGVKRERNPFHPTK